MDQIDELRQRSEHLEAIRRRLCTWIRTRLFGGNLRVVRRNRSPEWYRGELKRIRKEFVDSWEPRTVEDGTRVIMQLVAALDAERLEVFAKHIRAVTLVDIRRQVAEKKRAQKIQLHTNPGAMN